MTFRSMLPVCARLLAALLVLAPAVATVTAAADESGAEAAQGRSTSVQAGPQGKPGQSRPPSPRESPLLGDDRPWPWWNDTEVRRELGLTDETVQRINAIVQERLRASRSRWEEFQRERSRLSQLLSNPATTEASFELQVMKVDKLGSDLEIGRTMMLFRILRQLSPDQVKKLEDIARRRNGRDGRR